MNLELPEELSPFLTGRELTDRSAVETGLLALAAAESLTDALALDLLRLAVGEDESHRSFVTSLHFCDFVVERNSEWHIAPRIREALVSQLAEEPELSRRIHGRLLELSQDDLDPGLIPEELPRYLEAGPGRAYHGTFLSPEGALEYTTIANEPLSGQQWLAGYLADEQVQLGVIPPDAIEIVYLRAMILYRERRLSEAEPLLRDLAERPESRHEVGVGAHLIGRLDGKVHATRDHGEALLRKSLGIMRGLNDDFGVAQVLNTLGQLLGGDPSKRVQAENYLRESLRIGRRLDSTAHTAQVLHTLGRLLGDRQSGRVEAERLLRESLRIEEEEHDPFGEAQVLHTLGRLVGHDPARRAEAERLLRESLRIQQTLRVPFDDAKVLHTLGQLVGHDPTRRAEAEELLGESLELGRKYNRSDHQAQVLRSLSLLPGTPRAEAEKLLRESLAINLRIGNRRGAAIVEQSLERLASEESETEPN